MGYDSRTLLSEQPAPRDQRLAPQRIEGPRRTQAGGERDEGISARPGLPGGRCRGAGHALAACGSERRRGRRHRRSSGRFDDTGRLWSGRGGEDLVEKFSADQPAIELPSLSKTPPKGVTIRADGLPAPGLQDRDRTALRPEPKLSGGTSSSTRRRSRPEGYVTTWQQILDDKPDVIAYLGLLPSSAIKKQLAAATAGEHSRPSSTPPTATPPPRAARRTPPYTDEPVFKTDGDLMGAAVVADAGGNAKAVVRQRPDLLVLDHDRRGVHEARQGGRRLGRPLKVAAAGIGKTIPGAIVSYLQRNPDTEYVALAVNDFSVGLPAALKGAGLADKVKVISRAPTAAEHDRDRQGRAVAFRRRREHRSGLAYHRRAGPSGRRG